MIFLAVVKERENDKYSLSNYLDYLDIVDNKIFFEDLKAGIVLKSSFIYDEILNDNEINERKEKLNNLLNAVGEKENIQFIFEKNNKFEDIIEKHKNLNQSNSKKVKDLFESRINKLREEVKENKLFKFNLYIIITKKFENRNYNIKEFFYSDKKMNNELINFFGNISKELTELEDYYINYLEKLKLDIKIPDEQETIDFLCNQINISNNNDNIFKTKEDLVKSDFQIKENFIKNNNKYLKILTFKSRPERTIPTFIKKLMLKDLNFEYKIVLNIKKLNKEEQKAKIKTERQIKYGLKMLNVGSFVDEDKAKDERQLSDLLQAMTSGSENIFHLEFLIVVTGESKEKLERNTEKILTNIKEMSGAEGYKETLSNFQLFLSSLPGNSDLKNYRNMRVRTNYLSDFIPVFGTPKGSGKPLMLFRNKFGSLTPLDPFNPKYPNYNGITAGASGSGKSFTMSIITASFLAYDPIITIIDKGGSYKKLINNLEGDYFEVNENNKINPFDLPIKDKSLFWQGIIQTMVKDEGKAITNDDKIVIEETISAVQNKEIEKPTVSDFVRVLKEDITFNNKELEKIQKKYIRYLERFTKGIRGNFLNNKKSNINADSDITGFDLKGLESYPELMEIFMFYITAIIWYKAEKDRDKKKLFILDEVWSLMMTEQGSSLLKDLYRTLRKYHASIFSVSQSIRDFANERFQRDIMENISFTYILKQSDGADYGTLKNSLNLTDTDIKKIKYVDTVKGEYSEIFVNTPDIKSVVRLVPSSYEYWLATTNGNDINLFNKTLKEKDNNLRKTLNYLSKNYPKGTFGKGD